MKKILFLADVNSAHTQKWVSGVALMGFETALFSLSAPVSDWYIKSKVLLLNKKFQNNNDIFSKSDISKFRYFGFYRSLKKSIASFSPDIVHAHYATSYGLLGALSKKHPFLISVWGSDVFDFPNRSFIHRLFLKWILKKSDLILSTSKVMRQEVLKYSDKSVEVTPFGIDTKKFYNFKVKDRNNFTIGIIKSLESHYGIDYLIRAFRDVKIKYPDKNLRLIIVGQGSKLTEYKKLVSELDLSEDVLFTGKISQDEVPSMHNRIDLFVCPSLNESFGVSVLESSSCEVPVIVTNVGGLKEVVIDKETGLMVNPQNVGEIVNAISYFLDNPSMISQFGKQGRKFVEDNYNWTKNLTQITDIYKHL